MLRLAIRTWIFRRQRIALLLLGALLLSTGLGYLLSAEESVSATVGQLVADYWRSSYDILVRPPGERSELESTLDLIEPNAVVSQKGGITRGQWEQIRALPEVEVAAPIANLGTGFIPLETQWTTLEPGLYRVHTTDVIDEGIRQNTSNSTHYVWVSDSPSESLPGLGGPGRDTGIGGPYLAREPFWTGLGYLVAVAAVDPAEEAKLVGLDRALVQGRYFTAKDVPLPWSSEFHQLWKTPVLANVTPYIDVTTSVRLERLDTPALDVLAAALGREGRVYLDRLPGRTVYTGARDARALHADLIESLTASPFGVPLEDPPDPVRYRKAQAPDLVSKYPTLIEAVPLGAVTLGTNPTEGMILWRQQRPRTSEYFSVVLLPQVVGLFDTARLDMAKDPLNEVPMETYRPPTALLRLDGQRRPVDPPKMLRAGPTMTQSLLTPPPVLLTTIDAAEMIRGEAPIAAIRVRVRGIGPAGEASWRQLEQVAAQITGLTGLTAEITAGSSPRQGLTHIPGWDGEASVLGTDRTTHVQLPSMGYLELPWVQKGFGIGVIHETRLARTLILWAVLAVGILFALATSAISAVGWRKDVGLLTALGLPPVGVMQLLLSETFLIGLVAGLGGWLVAWIRTHGGLGATEATALIGIPPLAFGMGTLPAAARLAFSRPAALLRAMEVDPVISRQPFGPTVLGLALAGFFRRPARNLLTAAAFGVPSGLAGFMGFLTLRLGGYLSTTWLGNHVALRVAPAHYLTLALALGLAAVQTADHIWVSLQERQAEFGLLGALGAPPRAIYLTVAAEGACLGAAGGLLGALIATVALYRIYGALPAGTGLVWAVCLAVPVVLAAGAAQIPTAAALRQPAASSLKAE